jgi:polysaccharide biosynthesis transport protein
MPLDRFLAILRARWFTVALLWLLTVAVAVLAAFFSAQYKAVGMVLVEPKTVDPAVGLSLPGVLPNHIPTEIDVVQSERVALRAMRALELQNSARWRQQWDEATGGRGDFEAWVADQILRNFDVRPSRESNVLTLAFRSEDPTFSARVVNALMEAYIETSMELRTEPARQSNTVFDETAKRLRAQLESSQNKLSQFQQTNGLLVANDERMDVENVRLIELSSQVVALQSAAAAAAGRERQGNLQPENMQEVLRDPMVTALATDLARQEGRLAELASRMGERHPSVVELRNSINDLRARTAHATKRASDSIVTERKVAEEHLANARAALQAQRATVLRLKARRDEANVLQREVENAQRAYDAALTRSSQTAMESRGPRPNVSVLKVATAPALPWLKPWPIIAAASVIGLLLGIAAALVREMTDRRLRSIEDVTDQLEQPLLAVLGRRSALAGRARAPLLLKHAA